MSESEFGCLPGAVVEVRWTGSHREYVANGTVHRLNGKTVVVALNHAIPGPFLCGYPAGQLIKVPVPGTRKFSSKNGVYPMRISDDEMVAKAEKEQAARERFNKIVGAVLNEGKDGKLTLGVDAE